MISQSNYIIIMKITKKRNLFLKNVFSAFLILLFISPILFNHFNLTPVKADEELLESQEGLTEVRLIFGGAKAEQDPRVVIVNVVSIALGFIGAIFLAIMIFAGFKYMTAGGNKDKTSSALKMISNAAIGVVIIFCAWMITRFVIVMLNRGIKGQDTSFYPLGSY